jgi:hypothetical protein
MHLKRGSIPRRNTASQDNLTLLMHISLRIPGVEKTQEGEDAEVHGRGVYMIGVCEGFDVGVEMVISELSERGVFR